ncbi:hypothetical protein LCGC14_1149380 [marine sediment metagenome]|uniref:Uncharacterized protein n=1 Tax=marine sediment metagenome TaxID=412755 RepID=A0A0F9Q1P4_9ZZZZ
MASIIISVEKPKPIDEGVLDTMFSSSRATSEAVAKFWGMGLASEAELGKVTKTDTGYDVEIKYQTG